MDETVKEISRRLRAGDWGALSDLLVLLSQQNLGLRRSCLLLVSLVPGIAVCGDIVRAIIGVVSVIAAYEPSLVAEFLQDSVDLVRTVLELSAGADIIPKNTCVEGYAGFVTSMRSRLGSGDSTAQRGVLVTVTDAPTVIVVNLLQITTGVYGKYSFLLIFFEKKNLHAKLALVACTIANKSWAAGIVAELSDILIEQPTNGQPNGQEKKFSNSVDALAAVGRPVITSVSTVPVTCSLFSLGSIGAMFWPRFRTFFPAARN